MTPRWERTVEEEVEAVISCWLEDVPVPNLTYEQLEKLHHHVKIAITRQRSEYHV